MDGISVVIDGLAFAPILAVSVPQSGNAQINFQVPLERNASLPSVTPNSPGGISVQVNLDVVATQTPLPPPESGGFFLDQNGNILAHGVTPRPLFSVQIGPMMSPISLREFWGTRASVNSFVTPTHVIQRIVSPKARPARVYMAGHGCPVRSRIESIGCLGRANRFGNRTLEVPVKWAFSRKA